MKKLFVLVLGLVVAENAWSGCRLLSCGATWIGEINASLTADVGQDQCWYCGPGPNSCGNHDVVPYYDGVGDVIELYQCSSGVLNKFVNYEPGRFCDNSDLKHSNGLKGIKLANAKKTFSLVGRATAPKDLGDWNVFEGSASCIMVKCNPGFVPNVDKTECVPPDTLCTADQVYIDNTCVGKKSSCEATGGKWESNKTCTCDSSKNIKQTVDKYSCECLDGAYSWYSNKVQGCYNKAAQSAREKCVNSGGSWNGSSCSCAAAKHLKLSNNGACICESADYDFDSSTKQCELTDEARKKQICDSATSIATWNAIENECICNDSNKTFDYTTQNCISPVGYEACITQSAVAEWREGKCVCKQSEHTWNGSTCVESADSVIGGIVKNIEDIEAKFDTSKWKNAEGKFNTARLASDSIAAVVLGTVGGVVTSTVMKKSQVKNGFEDIKCVIGGQTVASYDDQFSVGLK